MHRASADNVCRFRSRFIRKPISSQDEEDGLDDADLEEEFWQLHEEQEQPLTKAGAEAVWFNGQEKRIARYSRETAQIKQGPSTPSSAKKARSRSRSHRSQISHYSQHSHRSQIAPSIRAESNMFPHRPSFLKSSPAAPRRDRSRGRGSAASVVSSRHRSASREASGRIPSRRQAESERTWTNPVHCC